MNRIAVIYHDADFDGKLSREVCHWHLDSSVTPVESFGWDYGRPIPDLGPGRDWTDFHRIYIVDLSVDALMGREDLRSKIVWIDHHKSAIDKWKDVVFRGFQLDGVAACRLCWNWFETQEDHIHGETRIHGHTQKEDFISRKVSEPALIRIAGEYDIWDHRDPDGKPLQFGLNSLTEDQFSELVRQEFAITSGFQTTYLRKVISAGYSIKAFCELRNKEYATKHAHTVTRWGLTFCALNIGQRGNSDLFAGAIRPEHQALLAWRYDGPTGQAMVSLYHAPGREDIDLSVIAVRMGGGGHRGACGFRCDLSAIQDILEEVG